MFSLQNYCPSSISLESWTSLFLLKTHHRSSNQNNLKAYYKTSLGFRTQVSAHNKKRTKHKQQFTKHIVENLRLSNTKPHKKGVISCSRESKHILLHTWHRLFYTFNISVNTRQCLNTSLFKIEYNLQCKNVT